MNFKQLLENYRNGIMSAEEQAAFERLLHDKEMEPHLQQLLDESLNQLPPVEEQETQQLIYQRIHEKYLNAVPADHNKRMPQWMTAIFSIGFKYAAVLVILLSLGAWFWLAHKKDRNANLVAAKTVQNDVLPGHDGAILTLANGQTVELDSAGNGLVAVENGTQVTLKNGVLAYTQKYKAGNTTALNRMSTPKGRQFQMLLPDGSKVWLNAESSIKYPTTFIGKQRLVELTGEAYFEIAKNPKMPFIIKLNATNEIEVLGTSLNINAYDNEPSVKTTLLNGAVRVNANGQTKSLEPGQQATVIPGKDIAIVSNADLSQVMAWKNGLFNFNGYSIKAVLRELARWYDLEVVYEAEPETGEVVGEIQRNLTLSQVIKVLQRMHVKYRIEDKKLIVMD